LQACASDGLCLPSSYASENIAQIGAQACIHASELGPCTSVQVAEIGPERCLKPAKRLPSALLQSGNATKHAGLLGQIGHALSIGSPSSPKCLPEFLRG
jgi:hypothetical protein